MPSLLAGFSYTPKLLRCIMRRLNLELPKFRLELRYKLVRRRKPLVPEPIVPTLKHVNRKYRTGTLLGKFARYLTDHKSARRVFAGNLAALAVLTTFLPNVRAEDMTQSDQNVIQAHNTLV